MILGRCLAKKYIVTVNDLSIFSTQILSQIRFWLRRDTFILWIFLQISNIVRDIPSISN